jgi:hypothetical protein
VFPVRLGQPGAEQPAVRTGDGTVYDLSPLTGDIDGAFLADSGVERAREAVEGGRPWLMSKGKSCETFNPLGPWLAAADEVPDPQRLGLRSWVNGEPGGTPRRPT